jgi:hypothetical protein
LPSQVDLARGQEDKKPGYCPVSAFYILPH